MPPHVSFAAKKQKPAAPGWFFVRFTLGRVTAEPETFHGHAGLDCLPPLQHVLPQLTCRTAGLPAKLRIRSGTYPHSDFLIRVANLPYGDCLPNASCHTPGFESLRLPSAASSPPRWNYLRRTVEGCLVCANTSSCTAAKAHLLSDPRDFP